MKIKTRFLRKLFPWRDPSREAIQPVGKKILLQDKKGRYLYGFLQKEA